MEGIWRVEEAARTCYNSLDKMTDDSYDKFIRSLISRGHETPLEFFDITLRLVTSRDVMAELTRHRIASACVQSQRFCVPDDGSGIKFVRPAFDSEDAASDEMSLRKRYWWQYACSVCESLYNGALETGMPKQDARKVLNNSVATEIVFKMNARSMRNFLRLRLDKAAYPEMRQLAGLIADELSMIPVLFDDIIKEKRGSL